MDFNPDSMGGAQIGHVYHVYVYTKKIHSDATLKDLCKLKMFIYPPLPNAKIKKLSKHNHTSKLVFLVHTWKEPGNETWPISPP